MWKVENMENCRGDTHIWWDVLIISLFVYVCTCYQIPRRAVAIAFNGILSGLVITFCVFLQFFAWLGFILLSFIPVLLSYHLFNAKTKKWSICYLVIMICFNGMLHLPPPGSHAAGVAAFIIESFNLFQNILMHPP